MNVQLYWWLTNKFPPIMIITFIVISTLITIFIDHRHPHGDPADVETNQQKQLMEAKATDSFFAKPLYT